MNYICNCKKKNLFNKSYTYWEDRAVTTDELDIINFLDNIKDVKFKSVLHIGVGNSYFAIKFAKKFIFLSERMIYNNSGSIKRQGH